MDIDPTIGILGRNELVREGLARILSEQGFLVEKTSSNPDDFISSVTSIELMLVDTNIGDAAIAHCLLLKKLNPGTRVVLMAEEFCADDVAEAFRLEAVDGYVIKLIACKPLAAALRLVGMGEKVFPFQMIERCGTAALATNLRSQSGSVSAANLSLRESEILTCLASGDANKVISRRLNISDATVKVHIKAILRKLKVANRTQAAIWAVSRGQEPSSAQVHPLLSDVISVAPSRMPPHQMVAA